MLSAFSKAVSVTANYLDSNVNRSMWIRTVIAAFGKFIILEISIIDLAA